MITIRQVVIALKERIRAEFVDIDREATEEDIVRMVAIAAGLFDAVGAGKR
jgi:hypothetical protein